MAEKIVKKVIIDVDDKGALKRTSKDSQTLNRNMKGLSKQSSNASKNFSKTAQGMQGVLVPAYAEVAARVFALTAVYQALTKASDFRILMQGQAEYAKRTGKNMADIAKQVQKASKSMLGFAEASSAVALATTSGISSSQIVAMTKAAVDSSTALGRSVQDTMDRLTRGIVKAEPEILDEIGVIIRLDKVYKDYALSIKKSTAELTEGEKATARYNAIMGQLEAKFGGIADKVDPNYIRASAAATMDILAQAGAKFVGLINPLFKFLSEVKSAIVVILLLIVKTLAGKIFPVFESFGKRIADYPKKMGTNITALTTKIKKMQAEIIKARNISGTAGQAMDKANIVGLRGGAYKAGAVTKGQQMTNLRSMRSTNVLMGKALAGKDSATYKGMTITRKMYQKRIEDEMRLRSEIGKTHKTSEIFWKRASVQGTKFNLTLQKTKMIWGSSAKSAAMYFTKTKQLMADRGMIMGMIGSVKILQRQWRIAGVQVGFYQKALKAATATTAVLGIVSATMGAIISKAFAWIMALTLILSLGKMILDMFVDFDTPFKRAADAAKNLNSELKEQGILMDQKDKKINFEGAAASFDEAMDNARFADNFATSLYESTSKAMKALSADMEQMGFWEGLLDAMKGIFKMSAADYQQKALLKTIGLVRSGPGGAGIMETMRDEYGVKGTRKDTDEYERRFQKWWWEQEDISQGSGDTRETFNKLPEGIAALATIREVPKILESYFQSEAFINMGEIAQGEARLKMYVKLNEEIDKMQKKERARMADLKAMNDAFSNLSKAQNKFTDSLLIKTAAHDQAVQQRHLEGIFKDTNILDSTKGLALQERGLFTGEHMTLASETLDYMIKANKLVEDTYSQAEIATQAEDAYKAVSKHVDDIVGGIKDWVAWDETLTEGVTTRLIREMQLANLNRFAPNTEIFKKEYYRKQMAEAVLEIEREKYRTMVEQNKIAKDTYSWAKLEQARWAIAKKQEEVYLGSTLNQDEYQLSLKQGGVAETIQGKYAAKLKDLRQNIAAIPKGPHDQHFWLDAAEQERMILAEKELAYLEKANQLLASMAPSAEQIQAAFDEAFNAIALSEGTMEKWKTLMAEMGWGKFMSLTGDETHMTRLAQMSIGSDKEIKALPGKIKATALVLKNLEIEDKHIKEHKILVEHRKKIAEIEMNVQGEYAQNVQKHLQGLEDISKLQKEVNKLELEENLKMVKDTMKTIADAFGSAVTQAFNDMFEGKDKNFWDTIKAGVGKGMTSAAATNLGNMAQKAAFGNKGIVASIWRMLPGGIGSMADDVFPKTQLEVARDSLFNLQELVRLQRLEMAKGDLAIFNKLGGVNPNSGGGIDWPAVISWVSSAFFGGGGTGRNMQGSHGYQMAMGGVARGGFRAFANGGIANRATLGMIGEGRYNEAVVPLPDGKSIPVIGGGGNNVTVNVAVDAQGQSAAAETTGSGARELGYRISQAVQSELVEQQRPGGLLSSY